MTRQDGRGSSRPGNPTPQHAAIFPCSGHASAKISACITALLLVGLFVIPCFSQDSDIQDVHITPRPEP